MDSWYVGESSEFARPLLPNLKVIDSLQGFGKTHKIEVHYPMTLGPLLADLQIMLNKR